MAKAKRLPSGKWRCLVYSHKDANGKRHYESFTASTRTEAEMLASAFADDQDRKRSLDLTVEEAVRQYIDSNSSVLSPSTLRGYDMDLKRMVSIYALRIRKINSTDIQKLVSDLSSRYAPKTVKNTYALLMSALNFCGIEKKYKVHLPTIPKKQKNAPEDAQVVALYKLASPKMKIAIMLAAFHSLRRGEICGLKYKDLSGQKLHVHSDIVRGPDGWIHKETPKTDQSNRIVYLDPEELKIIGFGAPEEYIVPIRPSTVNKNFGTLRRKVGLESLRFHDLRGYFASIAVAIGVPDVYASHLGGWRENSSVLKEHYQKPIVSINEGYAKKMNEHFRKILDDDATQNATQQ